MQNKDYHEKDNCSIDPGDDITLTWKQRIPTKACENGEPMMPDIPIVAENKYIKL